MLTLTRPQRVSLFRIWLRTREPHNPPSQRKSYRQFRNLARPLIGGRGCITIPFAGMVVGIETDGTPGS